MWQRLWEGNDIEVERRTKDNDRKPLIRPAPDNSQQRMVLVIPDNIQFSAVYVKELVRALLGISLPPSFGSAPNEPL